MGVLFLFSSFSPSPFSLLFFFFSSLHFNLHTYIKRLSILVVCPCSSLSVRHVWMCPQKYAHGANPGTRILIGGSVVNTRKYKKAKERKKQKGLSPIYILLYRGYKYSSTMVIFTPSEFDTVGNRYIIIIGGVI